MNKKHRIYFSLLLFVTILLFSECLSVGAFYQEAAEPPYSGVNETDWAALQAIYNKMTPYGQANSGWATGGNPCDPAWPGITCENGAVVKLDFEGRDFFCSIPEEITQLSNLREIRMVNMGLRGIIPENLFGMQNLQTVNFSHNLLTGPLPQGSNQTLQTLIIEDNKWTDQKQQELSARPDLSLCESVVQYPPEKNINMDPGLDGMIPSSFGYFPRLTKLDLSGNMLEGEIPNDLINLNSLSSIDLSDNNPGNPLTISDQALADKLNALPEKNLDGVSFAVSTAVDEEQTQIAQQQQTEQAYNEAIAQQQTEQAYNDAIAQTQQAYDAAIAQQQTQQAYNDAIALQQTQQAYNEAIAQQQQTEQANNDAIAQQQTQQAYEDILQQTNVAAQQQTADAIQAQSLQETIVQQTLEQEMAVPTATIPAPTPTTPSFTGVSEEELNNLAALFYKMTETGQKESNWFKSYEPCTWEGITCNENGYVTGLVFDKVNYFCSIPLEVTQFSQLKELKMTNMNLRGTIPSNLFAMPNIEVIDLSHNLLTGSLPDFINSPNLKILILTDNKLADEKMQDRLKDQKGDTCPTVDKESSAIRTDPNPGLDGTIPESWANFTQLQVLDLSGNTLSGVIPAEIANLTSLESLNLSDNETLVVTDPVLAQMLQTFPPENLNSVVLKLPPVETVTLTATATETVTLTATASETETVTPTVTSTPMPPTGTFTSIPTLTVTNTFTAVPTATVRPASPTPWPSPTPYQIIIVVVTATPKPTTPVWITSTPIRWVTATPIYWYTATPYWIYRTATPIPYVPPVWNYPTAYTYPTKSGGNTYPIWTPYTPKASNTPKPTVNPASLFEFTYVTEKMSADNIPVKWKYTGMKEYMINYLTADRTLYPGFAMEWTEASKVCNASTCTFEIKSIPDQLLKQGSFYIQLQAKDSNGRIYQSDPIGLQVAGQTTPQVTGTPTSEEPEKKPNFIVRFFRWLFGPIIRLFGGK